MSGIRETRRAFLRSIQDEMTKKKKSEPEQEDQQEQTSGSCGWQNKPRREPN